ncbi:DUF5819 family protein [Streptomyces sp. NPDC021969]|uniref:DUF5819 family protein n=1 Tax=unclassified Streptomyces TaxID=2593676 RepID=UPI0034008FAA
MDAYDKGSDARQGQGQGQGGPDGEAGPEGTSGAAAPAGNPEPSGTSGTSGAAAPAGNLEPSGTSGAAEPSGAPGPAGTPEPAEPGEPAGASRAPEPAEPAGPGRPAGPGAGVAALSPRYQVGAVVALAVVAVAVCAHIGLVFLHVAPSNTLTKQHGSVVDEWVFPEFEQNWKLFAPNPLQQNVSVELRAEVSTADGEIRTTRWYDLSAQDGRAIDGNPLPSHTQQNELRRAWDFFVASHDSEDRPVGLRGTLSETYLRRIALLRLDRDGAAGPGDVVERVQYRSRTTNVEPPPWSGEKVSDRPTVRELPWWSVAAETRDTRAGHSGQSGHSGQEGGAA